jgi:hypothetical protein
MSFWILAWCDVNPSVRAPIFVVDISFMVTIGVNKGGIIVGSKTKKHGFETPCNGIQDRTQARILISQTR